MGRPPGRRNADYLSKRRALARRVVHAMVAAPGVHPSLRELARSADVSVSTMRHYFDDREGIVDAALEEMGTTAQRYLAEATAEIYGPLPARLHAYVRGIVNAWTAFQVGRAHAVGLSEGVYTPAGPTYVQRLLEPFVVATEDLFAREAEAGHGGFADPRAAALALLGPVFLALVHQESLGGSACRPLDVDAFLTDHVDRFCGAWIVAD